MKLLNLQIVTRVMPGRVVVTNYSQHTGRKSPHPRPDTSCRGKDASKGRVDPSASFHGVEHKTPCEIDSHKNKRPSSWRTLPPELQARVEYHRNKRAK
jgi:hypothetical protein